MSEGYGGRISAFLSKIDQLKKLEMSSSIHCSKINSLIRSFKILPEYITSNPAPIFKNGKKAASNLDSLISSVDHLIQLCVQCNGESCVQFVLMTSLQKTFEEFLSIRQQTIADLQSLGLPTAANAFVLTSDELLSQDQVDLKLISNLLYQIHSKDDLKKRSDVDDKVEARFHSLKRKDINIDTRGECDLSGIITIPSVPNNLNLVLEHEQLVFRDVIGSGRSGRVFEGSIVGRPEVVAIKVLHCRELSPAELEMYRREIFTLSTLQHPSILKLLGYTNQPPFCLVTELLANGSLFKFLQTRPQELTPTDRTVIAVDVARGMNYMHERNMIHRDLKSLNILLDDNKRARICDFGLVRLKSYAPMTGLIGTPQWMAPEILMCSTSYDVKADVYSYGIVLWELLTGEIPYNDVPVEKLPYLVVQEKLRPTIPPDTPPDLANLITACWSTDPKQRPSFINIITLFNESKYHFPGTNSDELWTRVGGRKRRTPSTSDPLKGLDSSSTPTTITQLSAHSNSGLSSTPPSSTLSNSGIMNSKVSKSHTNNSLKYNSTSSSSSSTEKNMARRLPLNQVDQVVIKFVDSIETKNEIAFEHCLSEFQSMYKSNMLVTISPNSFMTETIKIIRDAKDKNVKIKVLKMLKEFIDNRILFDQFVSKDGFSLLADLMREQSSVETSELALEMCSSHLRKDIITIDLIKALLTFSGHSEQKVRSFALTTLFLIMDFQFEILCSMPSFIYHLLCFALKPLSFQNLEHLLKITLKFLKKIQTFPESILNQLVWLQTNTPSRLKVLAIECLGSALRFKEARENFPPEFWRTAMADFSHYSPIFKACLADPPNKFSELVLALKELSVENTEALQMLVEITVHPKCAAIVVTHLPIQNTTSPALLFKLYSNLSLVDGAQLIIGEENEFYLVCKVILGSKYQSEACSLIRRVGLNPALLETSGLIQHISSLIEVTPAENEDELWNLMSVIFTISHDRYFQCFQYVTYRLVEFLNGPSLTLKIGAFSCLVNFSVFDKGVDVISLLLVAAELVSQDNHPIQKVCNTCAKRNMSRVESEDLKHIATIFLKKNKVFLSDEVEFAATILSRAQAIKGFDEHIIRSLSSISSVQK